MFAGNMAPSWTSIAAFILCLRATITGTFGSMATFVCATIVTFAEVGLSGFAVCEACLDWNVSRLWDSISASLGRIRQAWHGQQSSGFQGSLLSDGKPDGMLRTQRTYALLEALLISLCFL